MSYLFFETEAELDAATTRFSGLSHESEAAARKRRNRRRPLTREVVLRDENGWGPVALECIDISPTGVFLASDLLFEPGEGFMLEFKSPVKNTTIRVWSRVVRVAEVERESPQGQPGMAFEFLDLTAEQAEELRHYAAPSPDHGWVVEPIGAH